MKVSCGDYATNLSVKMISDCVIGDRPEWWKTTTRPWKVVPYVPYDPIIPYNPWNPPYDPITPYEPCDPFPQTWPWTTITTTGPTTLTINPWRVNQTSTHLELALDLPGVKVSDIDLTFNGSVLSLVARRSDTGVSLTYSYYLNAELYDVDDSDAVLELGVITIKFALKKKNNKKISVRLK